MAVKNYYLKTMNAVSALAISAVLLGSVFTAPGWAMDEKDREEECHFARVPAEIAQHIFGFLPLKSQGPVRLVCGAWNELANDKNGGFKDLHAPIKVYKEERDRLLTETPDLSAFCQTLGSFRESVQCLSRRSPEEKTWFVTELFKGAQAKFANLSNSAEAPIESNKDQITKWSLLAFLRACDKFWITELGMQKWVEDGVSGLRLQWVTKDTKDTQDAVTLLGPVDLLEKRQKILANYGKRFLLSEELCERDQLSSEGAFNGTMVCNSAMDWQPPLKCNASSFAEYYATTATKYSHRRNWPLAAKYYVAALDKNPDLWIGYYEGAATSHFYLKKWELATNFYAIAIEKYPDYREADFYLNAGYAEAKSNRLKKAAGYFERFMDGTDANEFNEKLYSDTLDLMKKALTDNNSDERFRNWIDVVRSKNLETTLVPLEEPIGVNPGI